MNNETINDLKNKLAESMKGDSNNNKCIEYLSQLSELVLGQSPYPHQIEAVSMLSGNPSLIIQVNTGDGKTLIGVMTSILYALKGVRTWVMSTNDYLAERDLAFAKPLIEELGLTVGGVNEVDDGINIIYTSKNKFMQFYMSKLINREYISLTNDAVIIDEADSLLIDEGVNPFGFAKSKKVDRSTYVLAEHLANLLTEGDYILSDASVNLTDSGITKILKNTPDYFADTDERLTLRAKTKNAVISKRLLIDGKDYMIKDNQISVIDTNTGRVLEGFTFPNGLQQALQYRHDLPITDEDQVIASISFRSVVNQFNFINAMTGTIGVNIEEFKDLYNLNYKPVKSLFAGLLENEGNKSFLSNKAKIEHILAITQGTKQPLLICTNSIAESELIAEKFNEYDLRYQLLDAKNSEDEAIKISNAGKLGMITICTNMAGRGTDIPIDSEVNKIGGLFVISFSPKETRRMDDQLAGRCARRNDNGRYLALCSIEDDIFAKNKTILKQVSALASINSTTNKFDLFKMVDKLQKENEEQLFKARKINAKYQELNYRYFENYFCGFITNNAIASQYDVAEAIKHWSEFGRYCETTRHNCYKAGLSFDDYELATHIEYQKLFDGLKRKKH